MDNLDETLYYSPHRIVSVLQSTVRVKNSRLFESRLIGMSLPVAYLPADRFLEFTDQDCSRTEEKQSWVPFFGSFLGR